MLLAQIDLLLRLQLHLTRSVECCLMHTRGDGMACLTWLRRWQAGSTSIVEGEKEAWWLDDRTKRLIEQTMRLNGTLTFTVRPGTPLQLTREQVCRKLHQFLERGEDMDSWE